MKMFRKIGAFFVDFSPEIVIFLLALLPVIFTWGRLAIGGDVLIPLNSNGLQKYLYQWIALRNGQYFAVNYFPIYLIYKVGEWLSFNIEIISVLLLFLLNIVGGFGIYRLAKLFHEDKRSRFVLAVPVVFYLLSPALLNAFHYAFIYMFAPWFIYFVFKAIKNKQLSILDTILVQLVLAFCSFDLPNPKYVFHLFFIAAVTIIVSVLLRLIVWRQFWKIAGMFFVSCLVSSYFLLPLVYFAASYTPEQYDVQVRAGYKDSGVLPDYGSNTFDRVFKLHNDSLFLNYRDANFYNQNFIIAILSYVFIGVVVWYALRLKTTVADDAREKMVVFLLFLMYLFLAAGPNLPFGEIYTFVITKISVFAFLRTTAGASFFSSIFLSLLLMFFVQQIKTAKRIAALVIIGATVIVGYPHLNGEYYKNFGAQSQFTDIEKHGVVIPREYYAARSFIDSQKINARWFYPNSNLTYLNTTWGFFGPVIYNFLYNNYNIGYDKIFGNFSNHNVGFVVVDSSLMDDVFFGVKNTVKAWEDGFLKISYVSADDFLPKIYTGDRTFGFDSTPLVVAAKDLLNSNNNTRAVSSRALNLEATHGEEETEPSQVLEYRMINPTKYRIRVHGSMGEQVFVLSEQFHKDWRLYLGKNQVTDALFGRDVLAREVSTHYGVFENNTYFQASKNELVNYIYNGFVTSLNTTPQQTNLDFVSKNFQGTIQNDNLPSGTLYETWKNIGISRDKHFLVNGYANAWLVNADSICRAYPERCKKNSDGSYDFELVVEFFPQQIFYVSTIISGGVLVTLLCLWGWQWRMRRKSNNT